MSKILISYRREDSADITGRIYDRLIQQFDRQSVFKDVDSIPFGVDFRIYLDAQVAKCHVFLAVIGRDWMKRTKSGKGKVRLEDSGDFVRIEIESALKRGIPVIPVLVREASIPAADRLPDSMRDLAYRQGIAIRADPDFHRDMDRLIEYLQQQIKLPQKDASSPGQHESIPVDAAENPETELTKTLDISQQQISQATTDMSRQARLVSATVEWRRRTGPDSTPRQWVVYIDNDGDAPITVEQVKVNSSSRKLSIDDWGTVRPKISSDYGLEESDFDPSDNRPEVYVRFLDSYGQRWTLRKGVLKRVSGTR